MKRVFLFLCCTIIWTISYSQSVSPEVIASNGDHVVGSGVEVSWTIGESVIATFDAGATQLTQGFHQPDLVITSIEDLAVEIDLKVYPNPTSGIVTIAYSNFAEPLKFSVYDVLGRQLLTEEAKVANSPLTLDLTSFVAGSYFLHVTDQHSQTLKTFKILKNK
ncbi:MAG: T9SS type A sorting domain-containing protein [Bacteroidota bacterium]